MLEALFEQQGWRVDTLSSTHFIYRKGEYQFEAKQNGTHIEVTVPLPGSDSRYKTRFNSYVLAEDYLQSHLENLNTGRPR